MNTCEICRKSAYSRIILRDDGGNKYRLHQCYKCRVLTLRSPVPKTAEYYQSGEYRRDVPRTSEAVADARERDASVLRTVLGLYGPPVIIDALDMCAEDDSVSRILDCQVTRWGINDGPIAILPTHFFEIVTCFVSLEHVEHPVEMIRDGLARLTSDGIFVASVPDVDIDLGLRPHHTWYYCEHSLEEAVRSAGGMVLAELRYTPYKYIVAKTK